MLTARTMRWLAWTGPAFAVLFAVVVFALQGSTPGEKDSAAQVLDYYNSHQGRTLTSVFLSPLAATLLVLFFSHVRAAARERDASGGAGPTVMFGGAVLWASGLLFGSTLDLALVSSSDNTQPLVAKTLSVLSTSVWIPFIAGIAITMVGAALAVLSSRILPSWLGWVALVAGVASLIGPGGFLGFFVGPLWMLVAGVMLGLRSTATTTPTPTAQGEPPQPRTAPTTQPQ
ncbi:MAG: hypothetical protein ACRDYU_05640 [Actinomycetes bacterium]